MQIRILLLLVAAVRAIPLATSTYLKSVVEWTTADFVLILRIGGPASDADEAVAYPAQADQSWVDATRRKYLLP